MPEITDSGKTFWAEVQLSPADAGLYQSIRQVKRLGEGQMVSGMVSFCLQLLVPELPNLSDSRPIAADLEKAMSGGGESLRHLGSVLSGAEKILLDAAALREHLSRKEGRQP